MQRRAVCKINKVGSLKFGIYNWSFWYNKSRQTLSSAHRARIRERWRKEREREGGIDPARPVSSFFILKLFKSIIQKTGR